MTKNRGAVLIVVLGVLAVLALLATTFATLQLTERQIARNYLDLVRAKLLAHSGVEHAQAELMQMAQRSLIPPSGPQPGRYWGDDVDEDGPLGTPADLNQKLEKAKNPSFAVETDMDPTNSTVTPRPVKIEGTDRGFSGVMSSGTYAENGDLYTLKVTDTSGKLYVNEGVHHYRGNDSTASQSFRRILNRLGAVLSPPLNGLGNLIVDNRPALGYQALLELKKFLNNADYARVADFLTVHAWVDSSVANPVPYTLAHAQAIEAEFGFKPDYYYRKDVSGTGIYRFGRGVDFRGNPVMEPLRIYPATTSTTAVAAAKSLEHAVYAMDEINPQWIETTSRAPVNVNAARREILIALLSDLRGVFMSERRRNNMETSKVGLYHYPIIHHTYSPAKMPAGQPADPLYVGPTCPWFDPAVYDVPEGDELGFLYETWPIRPPSGTKVANEIYADTVADHLIACRERRAFGGFDYAVADFGGPFRSWRQFNAFCDNLVTIGVLVDPRPVYFDHNPDPGVGGPLGSWTGNITGYSTLVASDFQRKAASQAIADVLKANFNPNLHLNELNPDRNLFTLVDKTDLVVNSTEFTFTSTGYYDIESIGRVLRPVTGTDALAAGVNNELIAEAKVQVGVKLFDLIRETSQKQFLAGECSLSTERTNNNRTLEVGPEPDNGAWPRKNRWGGYVAFPTMGGNLNVGATKAPDTVLATPDGAGQSCVMASSIHTHLSWDFDAHAHLDAGKRRDMGSDNVGVGDWVMNYPDPGEAVGGPYDPVDQMNRYRLAESFDLPWSSSGGTMSPPVLSKRAPLDLRIDGGYIERNSGLAYWISKTSYVLNARLKRGVISYWVKPNFFPERSGKPRLYADMTRRNWDPYHNGDYSWLRFEARFTQFWTAGHNAMPGAAPFEENDQFYKEVSPDISPLGAELYSSYGWLPLRPESMVFGVGYGVIGGNEEFTLPGNGGGMYTQAMQTPSLNHEGHRPSCTATSLFKGHEWTHIILSWIKNTTLDNTIDLSPGATPRLSSSSSSMHYKVLVNGQLRTPELVQYYHENVSNDLVDNAVDWTTHYYGDRNSLRFGSPSVVSSEWWPLQDNFSADSTLDEIHFWKTNANPPTIPLSQTNAQSQWRGGRYSFPKASEATFTSQSMTLPATAAERFLSPASNVPPPPGGIAPGPGMTTSAPMAEILGISWTWFAEGSQKPAGGSWVPTLTDHYTEPGVILYPTVKVAMPGLTSLVVADDGYSAFKDSLGNPLKVSAVLPIKYELRFELPGATALNTILLTTPVVDDVTLYVSTGPRFTYYYQVGLAN